MCCYPFPFSAEVGGWSCTSTSSLCLRRHVMWWLLPHWPCTHQSLRISSSLKMEAKHFTESVMSTYTNERTRRNCLRDSSLRSGNVDWRVLVSLYHLRDVCHVSFDQINYGRKDRNLKAAEPGNSIVQCWNICSREGVTEEMLVDALPCLTGRYSFSSRPYSQWISILEEENPLFLDVPFISSRHM